jgi:hypothetical protein
MSGSAARYAAIGAGVAAVTGAAALPLALGRGPDLLAWSGAGWLALALLGVAGGAATVAAHGRAAFLPVLGACILARLLALACGAFAAATQGRAAVGAWLGGVLAGFVPTQGFEIAWFAAGRVRAADARDARAAGEPAR